MSLTNSFHSSAKKHAISDSGKLGRVERHNSRGYYSFEYDQSKIHALIGTPATIAGDVRSYINDTFSNAIQDYNDKQKRKDRKITTGAFAHFESNKSLDIANEVIFQLGDQEFWGLHRHDERYRTKKGKNLILKSYPEPIKDAMDELFQKQMQAYESIYETDKNIILAKMYADKTAAEELIAGLDPEIKKKYEDIQKIKDMAKRAAAIRELDDPEAYQEYSDATTQLATLKKLKLIERTEADQMHIKLVNGTAHYDEYSPHAHAISVCWADGYSSGLGSRVAKSVVLNKWSLSVIQDKMRDVAMEFIQEHTEIFQGEFLAEKSKGRNWDYDAKEIAERNHKALLQENKTLTDQIDAATKLRDEIVTESKEMIQVHREAREGAEEAQRAAERARVELQQVQHKQRDVEAEISDEIVSIERARQNPEGVFDNILFLASNCSQDLFERLDQRGQEMRELDMQHNLFEMDLNRQIEAASKSPEEERKLWDRWHRLSERYRRNKKNRRWNPNYGDACRAYYDAQYLLESTHNILVAAYALLKMAFYGVQKDLEETESWFKSMKQLIETIKDALAEIEADALEEYFLEDQAMAEYECRSLNFAEYFSELDKAVDKVDAAERTFRMRGLDDRIVMAGGETDYRNQFANIERGVKGNS